MAEQIVNLGNKATTCLLLSKSPPLKKRPDEKFETKLFLPPHPKRQGEGGLRKKGYFKYSYEIIDGKWFAYNYRGEKLFEVKPPGNFSLDLSIYQKDKKINLPLVTVITVVLNGEKYIEETIKSVINQTYPNVEYIIIDGGSSDNTINIIKKYEKYIDYWISEPDKGIYYAMNKGLETALGFIVNFLNSDDYYSNEKVIFRIAQEFIKDFKVDYIISDAIKIPSQIKCIGGCPSSKFLIGMYYSHVTLFTLKKIYTKIGYLNTNYKIAADFDMALNFIKFGFKCKKIDLISCYIREGGISDNGIKTRKEYFKVFQTHYGKSIAILFFMVSILLFYTRKFLPDKIANKLAKLVKSRYVKIEEYL